MPRRTRTVYRTAKRRARSYGRGLLGGMSSVMKNVAAGGIASVAAQYAGGINAQYGPGAALAGVGWFMKNDTLQTLGGMALGQGLAGQFLGTGQASTSGGWY